MPSTRKQKAKERRSRQADLESDIENVEVMLGSYSRNEFESNSGIMDDAVDFGSDKTRQDVVQNSEDFRSLWNSNIKGNSESTIETMRLVNSDVSKKIDELKRDLNTQIADTVNSIISEKVLPNNENIITSHNPVFREEVDYRCSRLRRTAEKKRTRNAWKTNSKPILVNSSRHDYFRGNSDVSHSSDEYHDITPFFSPPHCKCSLHPKFGGNSETRSFAGFIITFLEV